MKKIKEVWEKNYRLILTLLFSLVAFFIYGSISIHGNVWYDEAYQLLLTENSFLDIIKHVAKDHHAPFYALLLKVVTLLFGISPFVGRMVSLSAIICCFILAFYKIKDLFSFKTSIIFSLFLLSLSCIFYCSIEIRPYSWSMFFTLASTLYSISILKNQDNKSWIIYVIFSILAMYSHNFSFIYIVLSTLVFGIYIIILNKKLLKKYFISCIILFVAYLPWLPVLLYQYKTVADGFWIKKLNIKQIIEIIGELISDNQIILSIILLGLIVGIIYTLVKKHNKKYNYLIITNYIITMVTLYLISKYKVPIIVDRYLVTFIGTIFVVISDYIASLKSNILIFVIIMTLTINSIINYNAEIKLINEDKLIEMKEYFNNNEEPLCFIHYQEFSLGEFRFHFKNAIHIITNEISSSLNDYELYGTNVTQLNNIEELDTLNVDVVWVVNLYSNSRLEKSKQYFESWIKEEEYAYTNTYHFGTYYLTKLRKI